MSVGRVCTLTPKHALVSRFPGPLDIYTGTEWGAENASATVRAADPSERHYART